MGFIVYVPPKPGFPFLAVMILPNGEVSAVAYRTAEEAEAHNASAALKWTKAYPDDSA
jgi:hypothetical protein